KSVALIDGASVAGSVAGSSAMADDGSTASARANNRNELIARIGKSPAGTNACCNPHSSRCPRRPARMSCREAELDQAQLHMAAAGQVDPVAAFALGRVQRVIGIGHQL